jgi:hypothetical protein
MTLAPLGKGAEGIAKHAASFARALFAKDGSFSPMFLAVNKRNEVHAMVVPWANEDEKLMMLDVLRDFFKDQGITRYALLSEVWMVTVHETEMRHYDDRIRPSQRENRQEAVHILGVDNKGNTVSYTYPILRDEKGVSLGEELCWKENNIAGRMARLLEES